MMRMLSSLEWKVTVKVVCDSSLSKGGGAPPQRSSRVHLGSLSSAGLNVNAPARKATRTPPSALEMPTTVPMLPAGICKSADRHATLSPIRNTSFVSSSDTKGHNTHTRRDK